MIVKEGQDAISLAGGFGKIFVSETTIHESSPFFAGVGEFSMGGRLSFAFRMVRQNADVPSVRSTTLSPMIRFYALKPSRQVPFSIEFTAARRVTTFFGPALDEIDGDLRVTGTDLSVRFYAHTKSQRGTMGLPWLAFLYHESSIRSEYLLDEARRESKNGEMSIGVGVLVASAYTTQSKFFWEASLEFGRKWYLVSLQFGFSVITR